MGKYLSATASYTDDEGSGKSATSAATGQISASNAAPAFSSTTATRTLPENSGAGVNVGGGVITAADADSGDTLTYSLASGGDNASFEIDSSGQIETRTGVNHNFNFEATKKSYTVTVNVHDGKDAAGGTDTSTIDDSIDVTINLTNVDEPGTVTITGTPSGGSTLTASVTDDPDGGVTNESWRWARGDSAGGTFNNISGVLGGNASLRAGRCRCGQVPARHRVLHRRRRDPGKSASAVTGQISASNAVPTFDDGTMTTRTVPENSATGTNVGSVVEASDTDSNSGDTLTYSLSEPDGRQTLRPSPSTRRAARSRPPGVTTQLRGHEEQLHRDRERARRQGRRRQHRHRHDR